jgi:hypothetical protein
MTIYKSQADGNKVEINLNLFVTPTGGTSEQLFQGQFASLHERPGPKLRVAGKGITIRANGTVNIECEMELAFSIGLVQCVTGHNLLATYGVSRSKVRAVKVSLDCPCLDSKLDDGMWFSDESFYPRFIVKKNTPHTIPFDLKVYDEVGVTFPLDYPAGIEKDSSTIESIFVKKEFITCAVLQLGAPNGKTIFRYLDFVRWRGEYNGDVRNGKCVPPTNGHDFYVVNNVETNGTTPALPPAGIKLNGQRANEAEQTTRGL